MIELALRYSIPTNSPFHGVNSGIPDLRTKRQEIRDTGRRSSGMGKKGESGYAHGVAVGIMTIKLDTHSRASVTATHLALRQVSDMEYMLQRI